MSREIKFRAWIKDNKRMERCIEVNPFYIGDCDRLHWKHDEVELMQYTGLKDKNDKEIYEGDIIKLTYADKKTVYKCTVKYDEYSAYYMLEDVMDSDNFDVFCGFSNEQLEVIGNIYENPELLKE